MKPVEIHRQLPLDIEQCVLRLRNYHQFAPNHFLIRNHVVFDRQDRHTCEFLVRRTYLLAGRVVRNTPGSAGGTAWYLRIKIKGKLEQAETNTAFLNANISVEPITYLTTGLIYCVIFLPLFVLLSNIFVNLGDIQLLILIGFSFLAAYFLSFGALYFVIPIYTHELRNDLNVLFRARPDLMGQ